MSGLVLVALLAAEATAVAPASADGGPDGPRDTAIQMVQALLASEVEKLTTLTPLGFAFDGRQAWSQAEIRSEWTRALGRRPLAGASIGGVEIVGYDDMLKRYGPAPERWSKLNLSATRIAIVSLEGSRSLLVIFRKRGEDWVPLGISD